MSQYVVEIDLRDGTLRLNVEWSGTEEGLEDLYRRVYPDQLNVSAWVTT